jgi:dihydrofolate reductase
MSLPVVIVVAAAENGVIGRDNQLIWRLKTDLRHFRELTLGRPLIMGRKTFQSIGKPLPGRETIVLTRDRAFRHEGVAVEHTIEAALAKGQEIGLRMGADSIVVAGGAEVYALAMPHVSRIHLTRVYANPDGEAVFAPVDMSRFRQTRCEEHPAGPDDEHAFAFIDYSGR